MGDLKSSKLIVAKGVLFLVMTLLAAGLVWLEAPSLRVAALLAVLIWSSARFYYFLFYVLERYVDPTLRYTGIVDLVRARFRKKRSEPR